MTATADPGRAEAQAVRARIEAETLPPSLGAFARERAQTLGDRLVGHWIDLDQRLTYRELDRAADRLASSLLRIGVRKGSHVAVILPNCPAFPITWVAIARIGAVMVPVNPGYTREEMHFVLSDSDTQFCVVDHGALGTIQAMPALPDLLAPNRIIVHGCDATPEGMPAWSDLVDHGAQDFLPPTEVCPSDLLNLQYTSGTTGFPKGCMLSHEYWMLIGCHMEHQVGFEGDARNVLIWAPLFYMDPMWQLLLAMRRGGTAFIAARMSLSRFHGWLRDYPIHYCIFPEPALRQEPPSPRDAEIALRYISVFSWREEARREVEARFGVIARECFGMTEVGIAIFVPQSATHIAYTRSCGVVSAYRELRIVDDRGEDVAPGAIGELWIAGKGLLLGYYKRPEANAETFTGKWFHTGDLFRRDEQGYHAIVGRIKDMVKRSGENIAAIEVEAALRAIPEVEEAAVVPVPDPMRREEVKAYLKLREGVRPEQVSPDSVLDHCRQRLAAFKVPRYIAFQDGDFPRTVSRKIAKRKLIEQADDLRIGAYDAQDKVWR
jgi:acyl-CoA synthetase (AMP-forming)/AMP-acid ligase II